MISSIGDICSADELRAATMLLALGGAPVTPPVCQSTNVPKTQPVVTIRMLIETATRNANRDNLNCATPDCTVRRSYRVLDWELNRWCIQCARAKSLRFINQCEGYNKKDGLRCSVAGKYGVSGTCESRWCYTHKPNYAIIVKTPKRSLGASRKVPSELTFTSKAHSRRPYAGPSYYSGVYTKYANATRISDFNTEAFLNHEGINAITV